MEQNLNKRLFISLNVLSLSVALYFSRNINETLVFIMVAVSAIINQMLLVNAVRKFLLVSKTNTAQASIVWAILLKMILLFAAIGIGVLFIGDRIIVPLINYMIQLAILGVCLIKVQPKSEKV
jgi:hypothetical protein